MTTSVLIIPLCTIFLMIIIIISIFLIKIYNYNFFRKNCAYRQKVTTKFALIMYNQRDNGTFLRYKEITQSYTNLTMSYSEVILKDSCIWDLWDKFLSKHAKDIAEIFKFTSHISFKYYSFILRYLFQ